MERQCSPLSDLFKKLALSFAIGWGLIILLQTVLWFQHDAWIPIPFGRYDISLSQILGWGTVFSLIAKWVIDHKPRRPRS
ncbi:hypothetical protein [Desulfoplanes formicivorans]|nr:hypothetical protein [Desulfoplanes formicivorans]